MKSRYFIASLVFILLSGLFFSCDNEHPSDSRLLVNFQSHETEFNRLIKMVTDDAKVVRISPEYTWLDDNFTWPRPESELGITKARWEEYRQIFRKLGLEEGIAWYTIPDGPVLLLASVRGKFAGGSEKGYAFSTKPLSPLVESLDHTQVGGKTQRPDLPVYRKINNNWYLYYKKD